MQNNCKKNIPSHLHYINFKSILQTLVFVFLYSELLHNKHVRIYIFWEVFKVEEQGKKSNIGNNFKTQGNIKKKIIKLETCKRPRLTNEEINKEMEKGDEKQAHNKGITGRQIETVGEERNTCKERHTQNTDRQARTKRNKTKQRKQTIHGHRK